MAPEAEGHHFEEVIHHVEEIEQAMATEESITKKRHGLREYTSENGPLVHRDNRGRHIEFRREVKLVLTPSEKSKLEIDKEKEAILAGADLG